jgi:hypothetical protein
MRKIDDALRKSSLGTPEADRLAETVSDETAYDILRRSELPKLRARIVGALLALGAMIGALAQPRRAVSTRSSLEVSGLTNSQLAVRLEDATVRPTSWVVEETIHCSQAVATMHLGPQPPHLSQRTSRRLWIVATLDMVAVTWMLAVGHWFDKTSWLTAVITLGGHHRFVLIMALVGFTMLAGLAVLTRAFSSANRLELTLILIACVISIVALAGVLSVVLLLASSALLLGFVARLLVGR